MRRRVTVACVAIAVASFSAPAGSRDARCRGQAAMALGTGGPDVLVGTRARDVIAGGGGADVIEARGAADLVCGGRGADRIGGGPGNDRIRGGRGDDVVDGDDGDDWIGGGRGADACFQGPGSGRTSRCAPVVAAAGDVACDPEYAAFNGGAGTAGECHMRATADLLLRTNLAAVLVLGDVQYEDGAGAKLAASYDPSWGRARALTRPVPGNHDYGVPGATGYFGYFGSAAGVAGEGWYSFDIGGWHLVGLNSNCAEVGGCGPGATQHDWLLEDLRDHAATCTLAYWHHARFSSGGLGGNASAAPLWEALDADGADVVLSGHDHFYERLGPLTPGGTPTDDGIRSFVVGTGGRSLRPTFTPVPGSEVRSSLAYGILELALLPGRYEWRFVREAGGSFTDSGSAGCR